LPSNLGRAFISGVAEVAKRIGHISEVGQWPVLVCPQSWPTRSSLMSRLRCWVAAWVIRSTVWY
jgi:hypothetical protein